MLFKSTSLFMNLSLGDDEVSVYARTAIIIAIIRVYTAVVVVLVAVVNIWTLKSLGVVLNIMISIR